MYTTPETYSTQLEDKACCIVGVETETSTTATHAGVSESLGPRFCSVAVMFLIQIIVI